MGLQKRPTLIKVCSKCNQPHGVEDFLPTRNKLFLDETIPICSDCLCEIAREADGDWEKIDKLCQYLDIPFVPKQWQKISEQDPLNGFLTYARVFQSKEYEKLGWGEYYREFKKLKDSGVIENELPLLKESERKRLVKKWGPYDDDDLGYLEDLENGIYTTQNVNGKLSKDQAQKLCKLSLLIDSRIREGADCDKLLGSYDKLIKIADFTPKNVKNVNDFESVGELYAWLEKRGWVNKYYDDVKRDVVDETMANIQQFCQRLYTNEPGIGEEIEKRIESLKNAKEIEDSYGVSENIDLDQYSNDVLEALKENDEFEVDL